jgi:hypothetical protein
VNLISVLGFSALLNNTVMLKKRIFVLKNRRLEVESVAHIEIQPKPCSRCLPQYYFGIETASLEQYECGGALDLSFYSKNHLDSISKARQLGGRRSAALWDQTALFRNRDGFRKALEI